MKLLVLGATGLLGTALQQYLRGSALDVYWFRRDAAQPCDSAEEIQQTLTAVLQQQQPDCVLNLVAATNVDSCEQDLAQAALLNTQWPHILADLCRAMGPQRPHMVHLSTDQVYAGDGPHREERTQPLNVYALTKLLGEYPVLRDGGCVLRSNFFGKSLLPGRASFSDWIVEGVRSGKRLNVFNDVLFSPLGFNSLCQAMVLCVQQRQTGLYNLGSQAQGLSKARFAELLLQRLGLPRSLVNVVGVESAGLKARRPTDMRMDSSRFAQRTGFVIPSIEQEIEHECQSYLQV